MADLLVDEGLGQDLVQQLRSHGYRAFHTLEILPKGTRDSLVFLEAQRRQLTIFTWNRDDYERLAHAWADWGQGDHHGVIARQRNQPQLSPTQAYQAMEVYCRDKFSFANRIELF